jgi:DNA-binding NtrC family response regulator
MQKNVIVCDSVSDRVQRIRAACSGFFTVIQETFEMDWGCQESPPLAILIFFNGTESGTEVAIKFLQNMHSSAGVMLYGNVASISVAERVQLTLLGVTEFFDASNPVFPGELANALVHLAGEKEQEEKEKLRLAACLNDLGVVASSQTMRQVFLQALKASRHDFPVLVEGETGVGKEEVAKVIHNLSGRPKECLAVVNCSAISPMLAESDFFGHVHGSFSGSTQHREGIFSNTSGGTLILDEVGELPLFLQPKVLRVVEKRVVRPVGADKESVIDTRVISITNQRLCDMVAQGRFREDLYHRLAVFEITVPPLRDRLEEIGPLALQFFARHGTKVKTFGSGVLEVLQMFPWTGNSRQLESLVRLAIANGIEGEVFDFKHLPKQVLKKIIPHPVSRPCTGPAEDLTQALASQQLVESSVIGDLDTTLAAGRKEADISRIKAALKKHGNNRIRAAAELGISRMGLYKKLHKYGLIGNGAAH